MQSPSSDRCPAPWPAPYIEAVLTPATLPLFLRHLDGVDGALATRVGGRWQEPGLSSLLCDLLDEDAQEGYSLTYPLSALREDLTAASPLASLDVSITTHQYDANVERWVTQSDLGLVIDYRDDLLPTLSHSTSVLLQAKRLYPRSGSTEFDDQCKFEGYDAEQGKRIQRLRDLLGSGAVQHLLYCPRTPNLAQPVVRRLAHYRQAALDADIFDHSLGLARHWAARDYPELLDAGVFIAEDVSRSTTLKQVHSEIFRNTVPLSWFVVERLGGVSAGSSPFRASSSTVVDPGLLRGIVEGDTGVVDKLRSTLELGNRSFRVLPAHTIRISINTSDGTDLG